MLKCFFDFLITIVVLAVMLLPMLVLALLIRLTLGAPVLFCQRRAGQNSRIITVYKFRTMADLRDEHGNLLCDDERLSRFGIWLRRYSLDELPQLLNVLKGNMSLVGPRPLLPEYLPNYTAEQARRHEVKPGITGWAQVNGRNAISWEEKFVLDVWYVDNRSLGLDIKILWRTLLKVIRSDGINQGEHTPMEKFKGSKR